MLPVPAVRWSFPTLYLQSLHNCLDPYPEVPLRCFCPFLPGELQPHHRCTKFGTPNNCHKATSTTTLFSGRQSFRYFQAPMLVSPPDGTYRAATKACRQPCRLHHAMDWRLPSRTVVPLYQRFGQFHDGTFTRWIAALSAATFNIGYFIAVSDLNASSDFFI